MRESIRYTRAADALRLLCVIITMSLILGLTNAQDTASAGEEDNTSPFEVTTYRRVVVRAGPSPTYRQVDLLNPGIPVTIVQRNAIGNWIQVQRSDDEGDILMDGWIIGGYINIPDDLHYSNVPVTQVLADANPSRVNSQSQSLLYDVPIIPTISDAMLEVYERGQELGRNSAAITKVGDSLSASTSYIQMFAKEEYELGPYDYLEPTLLYYRDSTEARSEAAQVGMNSLSVFDPLWSSQERCEENETPLDCEFRRRQPSVAFILYGPNDVRAMNTETYDKQIRMLIETSTDAGVIPVLMTFSTHPDEEFFWQGINFNIILTELADEYDVPLINLWAATRHLPQFGLGEDLVHLTHPGFQTLKYDSGHEAFFGIALQNLLVLRTLHEIRLTLGLGERYG